MRCISGTDSHKGFKLYTTQLTEISKKHIIYHLYADGTQLNTAFKPEESEETMGCHSTKQPVTTMLTYPWKCTVLHCNHLGNTWKPLVLMTRHFDYCLSASEGDNQSVGSSAPVVSRCFPGGYNVKLYISRGRLAWWLLAFLHSVHCLLTVYRGHTEMDGVPLSETQ